jgi:hypothetical protein
VSRRCFAVRSVRPEPGIAHRPVPRDSLRAAVSVRRGRRRSTATSFARAVKRGERDACARARTQGLAVQGWECSWPSSFHQRPSRAPAGGTRGGGAGAWVAEAWGGRAASPHGPPSRAQKGSTDRELLRAGQQADPRLRPASEELAVLGADEVTGLRCGRAGMASCRPPRRSAPQGTAGAVAAQRPFRCDVGLLPRTTKARLSRRSTLAETPRSIIRSLPVER